jgi:hypothetical protein
VADNTFDSTPDICYIFGLANPPAGPQTVVISFSNANYPVASSITVTGSDTTTCFSHTNHNSGSSASTTVTCTSATGELVLDTAGCDGSGALIVSGPQTAYMDGVANGGETVSASTTAGAATVTPTYTLSSAPWAAVVASFKAAAGGTGIAVWPYRM